MISEAFDPALLRTFVAVCRHGSLSRAAQQSGRAQSALSTQIRRLEERVGKRLLHRTGRGVVPTTEGEMLLGYAQRILALGEAAAARLGERALHGNVRVGLSEDVAIAALPAALARLRRSCPDLHLEIVIDHSDALAQAWQDGVLDIAIGACSAFSADPVQAWMVDLQWVCAIDEAPDPARPIDLIVYAEPCAWRRLMFQTLASAGRDFRVALTSHNIGAICAAVELGLGVALLTPEAVRPNTMRVLPIADADGHGLSVRYGLFAGKRATPCSRALLALLRESLQSIEPAFVRQG
ncbi:LysR family transcriptional regulator [Orrella sp. JC864]|uniref:LysR family transcriptional regulator n=1 Tax=Orrella sp. JC864 TaxID=3120298 RepID=UPI00300A9417